MPDSIFLSYCQKDENLALTFIDQILIQGLGIRRNAIYRDNLDACAEQRNIGALGRVRNAVRNKNFFIALLTSNYFESWACRYELGAGWGGIADEDNFLAFLTPELAAGDAEYHFTKGIIIPPNRTVPMTARDFRAFYNNQKALFAAPCELNEFIDFSQRMLTYLRNNPIETPNELAEDDMEKKIAELKGKIEGKYRVYEKGESDHDNYSCEIEIRGSRESSIQVLFHNFYNMVAQGVNEPIEAELDGKQFKILDQDVQGLSFSGYGEIENEGRKIDLYFTVNQSGEKEINHAVMTRDF